MHNISEFMHLSVSEKACKVVNQPVSQSVSKSVSQTDRQTDRHSSVSQTDIPRNKQKVSVLTVLLQSPVSLGGLQCPTLRPM